MAMKISEIAYQKIPRINQEILTIENSMSSNDHLLSLLQIEKKQLEAISENFSNSLNKAQQLASQAITSSLKFGF